MTTLPLERPIEQGAIANNLGFAQNNLFASTNQAIDFWLEALKKRDNLPKKEYLEYLSSFGWSNRNASPYIKMADFIRSNLMECREAIAILDIRTLIRLPRIRYATIVEAIKEFAPTQKQVTDLIKKLPPAPRGYKSAEQRQDEVFEVNVPSTTGAVIIEAAELLGFSSQRLILLGAKLVKAIASGDDSFADLTEQIQVQAAKLSSADEEDSDYLCQAQETIEAEGQQPTPTPNTIEAVVEFSCVEPVIDTWQEAQEEVASYIEGQAKDSDEIIELLNRLQHLNYIINTYSPPKDASERMIVRSAADDRREIGLKLAAIQEAIAL